MKIICIKIDINAPAEFVWQVLTDFDSYPVWNPYIRRAKGVVKEGEILEICTRTVKPLTRTFHPVVLKAEPNRELRWIARFAIPGLFNGEHSFKLEPLGDRQVRFIQEEIFTGLLIPLWAYTARIATVSGFSAMNEAIKRRAETLAAAPENARGRVDQPPSRSTIL